MTPAEWRAEEGVVVVDVVARRLRGNQGALLHGNDDVGEWSVGGGRNAGTGRLQLALYRGMEVAAPGEFLKAARTKRRTRRLTLRLCSKVLSRKGDCGSGNDGERWTAEDVQCSWLQMPLQPWMGGGRLGVQ
jgi:hypothetical protein